MSLNIKQVEKLSIDIYNNLVVLHYFCQNQQEIEALYNITPLIKTLLNDADILNSLFINNELI